MTGTEFELKITDLRWHCFTGGAISEIGVTGVGHLNQFFPYLSFRAMMGKSVVVFSKSCLDLFSLIDPFLDFLLPKHCYANTEFI